MSNLSKLVITLFCFFTTSIFASPDIEDASIFKKQREVLNDGNQYLTYAADIDDGRFVIIVDPINDPDNFYKKAVARYIIGKKVYRVLSVNYCVGETDLCGNKSTLLETLESFADTLYNGEYSDLVWRITYVKNDKIVSTEELVPIPKLGDLKDFVGVFADDEGNMDEDITYDENGNIIETEIYHPHQLGWSYGPKVNP